MKIILGNLKMNFLQKDFYEYVEKLRDYMGKETPKVELGLAIPYIYLKEAANKLGSSIKVMSQDLHYLDSGAFTSSISAAQIASLEVPATLIGHSECRKLSQNSLVISNKVHSALKYGMDVVYCCGEDPIREVSEELKSISEEDWKKIIIAYEPLEAIGSGSAMNVTRASDKLSELRNVVVEKFGVKAAENARFIYGGSVNLENYKDYLSSDAIDGVLVGGASLKIDDFWKMATLA